MAQDGEVSVKLKITAENGGVEKAEKGLHRVKNAAKRTADESKSGFEQMQSGVGKVSGAFGALRNVLTGFGIGAFVTTMTAGIGKIIESFGASKKSAEEFRSIQSKLAEDKAISSLANDYAKLTDAINAAAAAENHQLEMIDLEVANRRKLASAKMEAAKEDEIASLDANANDYAEQLDKIEKKYASIKAAQDASNATEDIVLARQKLNVQADQKDKQATAQDAASKAIEAKISAAKREKSKYDFESVDLNDEDKTGVLSAIGKTAGQLFSGDWGSMSGAKTKEGDAIRKAAAEKSAAKDMEIMSLEEELRKSNESAAKMRQDAKYDREKAEKMGKQIESAGIEGETARKTASRGEKTAQSALDKKHAEQAKEEKELYDAQEAKRLLTQQKAEIQQKIKAQEQKKNLADKFVYESQGDVDTANIGGTRQQKTAANERLQAAKRLAQEVDYSADSAINALTKTLQDVEKKLNKAASVIEKHSKQQSNFVSESPAGA